MSKFDSIKDLLDDKFKRLTGIHGKTFEETIEILQEQYRKDGVKGEGIEVMSCRYFTHDTLIFA
jgi:hypothetical protein